MRGQEEVSPHSLGLCHFVSCPEEGRKGGGSFGGPAPQSLLAEEAKVGAAVIAPWAWRGSCGGAGVGDRRKGAGLLWEVEMDFPLMRVGCSCLWVYCK